MLKLEKDGAVLRITIDAVMGPVTVEDLIHQLALLRAEMVPAVASTATELLAGAGRVLDEDDPQVYLRSDTNGDVLLALRNRGLGWLRFRLADPQAREIGAFLVSEDRKRERPQH